MQINMFESIQNLQIGASLFHFKIRLDFHRFHANGGKN